MSYPMPQKSIGLLEEAARMASLNHENIVRLIAVSKLSFTAFRPMLAIEWLPGGSLAEFFREEIRARNLKFNKFIFVL
jgi:serine/threonine protein kinase